MNGRLYIVATPIGNLEDITLRALRVLKEVDFIAAEDSRRTLKLLNHYEIKKRLLSFHEHNSKTETERILKLLKEGKNIALVSDAGTPCISDPGGYLVKIARAHGIDVVPVPGPSAIVTALSVSGIIINSFYFAGFLPRNRTERRENLKELITLTCPVVAFESPHRILGTIEDLKELSHGTMIILFREITKLHEEVLEGTPEDIEKLLHKKGKPSGEIILIISHADSQKPDEEELKMTLKKIFSLNLTSQEIIEIIRTLRNVPRNMVYKEYLRYKGGRG